RKQFGQPVASFQGIQFMLADIATQIEAARHLVFQAATKVDAKAPDLTKIAAMAKLFASDMAMRVTTDCVQLLGGYGYISDYPVERMMRDAKITQIYEGTNQIQRVVIARALLRGAQSRKSRRPRHHRRLLYRPTRSRPTTGTPARRRRSPARPTGARSPLC